MLQNNFENSPLKTIREYCSAYCFVGSRVICQPAPERADCDVICLAKSKEDFHNLDSALFFMGYNLGGSFPQDCPEEHLPEDMNDEDVGWEGGFRSYASESCPVGYNFIVTLDESFYLKFLLATKEATKLNLLDKEERIKLFQKVLYGNSSE